MVTREKIHEAILTALTKDRLLKITFSVRPDNIFSLLSISRMGLMELYRSDEARLLAFGEDDWNAGELSVVVLLGPQFDDSTPMSIETFAKILCPALNYILAL